MEGARQSLLRAVFTVIAHQAYVAVTSERFSASKITNRATRMMSNAIPAPEPASQ